MTEAVPSIISQSWSWGSQIADNKSEKLPRNKVCHSYYFPKNLPVIDINSQKILYIGNLNFNISANDFAKSINRNFLNIAD